MVFLSLQGQYKNRAKKITWRLAARNLRFLLKSVGWRSSIGFVGQSDSQGQTNFEGVSPLGQWHGKCRATFFRVVRLLCAAVRGSGQGNGIYGVTGTDFRSSLAKVGAGQGHNLRNGPVRIHALEGWGRGRGGPTKGNGGTFCSCKRHRGGREKGERPIFYRRAHIFCDSRRGMEFRWVQVCRCWK